MKVLRFGEFLNESAKTDKLLEHWEGSEVWKYDPTPLTQEMKEDTIKKDGNRASAAVVYLEKEGSERKPVVAKIESMCKNFLSSLQWLGAKWQWGGMRPDTVGTYREIIPFEGNKRLRETYIYASFLGDIQGNFGKIQIEFSIKCKNGLLPEFEWSSDRLHNSLDEYLKQPKVQDYFKKAYLEIPDTQEGDTILMNKKAKKRKHWAFNQLKYNNIPKSFQSAWMADPALDAFMGIDDDYNYGEEMVDTFKNLNKKYYTEWQKLHRKGITGALKNLKAWWLSLKEHEEYMGSPINEMASYAGRAWEGKLENLDNLFSWMYRKGILSSYDKERKDEIFREYYRYYNDGDTPKGIEKERGESTEDALERTLDDFMKEILANYAGKYDRRKFRFDQLLGELYGLQSNIKFKVPEGQDDMGREENFSYDVNAFLYFYKKLGKVNPEFDKLVVGLEKSFKKFSDTANKQIEAKLKENPELDTWGGLSTNKIFAVKKQKMEEAGIFTPQNQKDYDTIVTTMDKLYVILTNVIEATNKAKATLGEK
jgi:hypothetical protein